MRWQYKVEGVVQASDFKEDTTVDVKYATSQVWKLTLDAVGFDRTYEYTYDANGNITSVTVGGKTTSYTYDGLNQLTKEVNQAAGKTWEYTYDNGGNITSRKEYDNATGALVSQAQYTYGDVHWGDLLTAYNGQTITYDGIGNPEDDGTWAYTWENGRQLASMTSGATTWSYKYNADGLRTERSNGTVTYDYIYSGSTLIQMTVGSDVLYFIYDASGTPMAVTFNNTKYFYVTNLQGDVIAILDTAGNAVVEYTYDAWGNHLSTTGTMANTLGAANPLRYRGYVYDHETSFYYLQSRYYDPEMGRFINADAYASTGQGVLGNNMFAYCNNNPVFSSDPTGEAAVTAAAIVGAAVAGGLYGLFSYLCSTSNPTAGGAIVAVLTGAGGAIASVYAGTAGAMLRIGMSGLSGLLSAVSAWIASQESGGGLEDNFSSALAAFLAGAGVTYLGSYLSTAMLSGLAELGAMFDLTIGSGLVATGLSFPADSGIDTFIATLTFAPNYIPAMYTPSRTSGGLGKGQYYAVEIAS